MWRLAQLGSARGLAGPDADAWVEFMHGGGGWATHADACSGLLNLVVDGEKCTQGTIDRGGVGEAVE